MWTCEKCKVVNMNERPECAGCHTRRPVQPDDLPEPEAADPESETKELKALKPEDR